jgi:hypothetical protein
MKVAATMSNNSSARPSAVYHQVLDKIHAEKMARLADKTISVCLIVFVMTGILSLFASVITRVLAAQDAIMLYCSAMSKITYTVF